MNLLRGKKSNKRSRARGSSSTNPTEEQPFNNRHPSDIPHKYQPKLSLEKLQRKRIIGHRTMDWGEMNRLGLSEEFNTLLTEDWKKLFAIRTSVYRDLTLEFFSTYRMDITVGNTDASAMTFKLGGRTFTMSLAEFGVSMGLYSEIDVLTANFTEGLANWPVGINAGIFWETHQIGTEVFDKRTKQSAITRPAYRILLRVIAESISNRENCPNNATQQDLFYLFCIITHRPCNLARCLAIYLYERGHGKDKGAIAGGSFVCHLAFRLGVANREQLEETVGAVAIIGLIGNVALRNIGIVNASGNLIESEEDDEDSEHEGGQNPPLPPPPQQDEPYSMQSLARQLNLIQQSQLNFHTRYDHDQQQMGHQFHRVDSQLDWLTYGHTRYQPYMEHWAQRESESMGRPLPTYSPPDIFIPPHYQGGFYYPPRQPGGHDTEAGGSRDPADPIRFGTYSGDGTPSVFQDPQNMDE